MSDALGVAVVGYGYWGPNLARNIVANEDFQLRWVCDRDAGRLASAGRLYPGTKTTGNLDEVLADPAVTLVAIATPVSTHATLAQAALEAGKHVLVEKPLAMNEAEATALVALARRQGRQIFVDHTFVFTPAVRKMKELLDSGELGQPLYYDSQRINLGLFQRDVDVIWDLAPHDLSILDFLFNGALPASLTCVGAAHFGLSAANLAYLTLRYSNDVIAHVAANWLAPVKIRQILLCGDRRMVVYDDISVTEKIRVYDRGVAVKPPSERFELLVQYREGDMFSPRVLPTEALKIEFEHIARVLREQEKAIVDGEAGLRVVKLLTMASQSMAGSGAVVELASR